MALGHLAGVPRYVEAAGRAIRRFGPSIGESPGGFSTLLEAAHGLEHPPTLVILAGEPGEADRWVRALRSAWRPSVHVYRLPAAGAPEALVKGAVPAAGARAWVCHGMTCRPPVDALDDVEALLREGRSG